MVQNHREEQREKRKKLNIYSIWRTRLSKEAKGSVVYLDSMSSKPYV